MIKKKVSAFINTKCRWDMCSSAYHEKVGNISD